MLEFNTLEEMEPYHYGEDYFFGALDIKINFDMKAKVNIYAKKIEAQNLDVLDIYADDITARSVFARNISSEGRLCVDQIYAERISAAGFWLPEY